MSKRRRTERRHALDPNCYWCGKPTVLCDDGLNKLLAHHATLDHVYPRSSQERQSGNFSVVLACNGCNQWRNTVESKLRSPAEQIRKQGCRMRLNPGRTFLRDPFQHLPETL
jgi:hypothetical protein